MNSHRVLLAEIKQVPIEYRYYTDGLVELRLNDKVIESHKYDKPPVVEFRPEES